jgi:hypothetical protein
MKFGKLMQDLTSSTLTIMGALWILKGIFDKDLQIVQNGLLALISAGVWRISER